MVAHWFALPLGLQAPLMTVALDGIVHKLSLKLVTT
jgi:hypothetical protein